MKHLAIDVVVGVGLAVLIAGLMLFVSFDSTFIYQRF
jgi:hypothetical protein